MNAEMMGVLFGVFFGLIMCVVIFIACNSNRKIKSEYDERQKAIRGEGYKLGFYTVVIYLAFLTVFFVSDIEIPFVLSVLTFFGIAIGVMASALYSIFHGAYWGLNNNKKSYGILFIIIAIINLAAGIMGIVDGSILLNHQTPMINLICGIMISVIGIAAFVKGGKKEEDEEDE